MSAMATPKAPKGYDLLKFPTRGGQSADIYSQLAGGVQQGLPDILQQLLGQARGAPGAFQASEQQAMDQFNQQIAPGIAQRYAGSGISGSSGMQNALAGAGGNLAQSLQSQRQELMQRSMQDVLRLGELLFSQPDLENYFRPKEQGFDWTKKFGGGAKGALGGAATGASIGSIFPGIGTAVGAGVGAGIGGLGGFFTS